MKWLDTLDDNTTKVKPKVVPDSKVPPKVKPIYTDNPNDPRLKANGVTTADSLSLYNNTMDLLNYYSKKNKYVDLGSSNINPQYTDVTKENESTRSDFNKKLQGKLYPYTNRRYESVANTAWNLVKGFTFGKVETDGLDSDNSFTPGDYYKKVDENKYKQRERENNIIDMEAPMALYDKRISPTKSYTFQNKNDKHNGISGTNPVLGDISTFYGYDPYLIKPASMLSPAEKYVRDSKLGLNKPQAQSIQQNKKPVQPVVYQAKQEVKQPITAKPTTKSIQQTKIYTDKVEFEKANQAFRDSLNVYNVVQKWNKITGSSMSNNDKVEQQAKLNKNTRWPSDLSKFQTEDKSLYIESTKEGDTNLWTYTSKFKKPVIRPIYQPPIKSEETKYQEWKNKLPKNLQYEGDYDLKGFYNENPTWTPDNKEVHMTDKFKLPNHPTFSNESKYYKEGMPAVRWEGETPIPINKPLVKGKIEQEVRPKQWLDEYTNYGNPNFNKGSINKGLGKREEFKYGGTMNKLGLGGGTLDDNKTNTLEGDIISKILMNRNKNKDFVQRAYAVGEYPNSNMFSMQDPNQFGDKMTHKMGWGEDDSGQAYMFPTIMNNKNEEIKIPNQYADYISSVGYKKATGMIPELKYGGTLNKGWLDNY